MHVGVLRVKTPMRLHWAKMPHWKLLVEFLSLYAPGISR
jgi:hypothetical protein